MRRIVLAGCITALAACTQQTAAPQAATEIRTIENTPINALPVEPLPTIDQAVIEARAYAPAETGTAPETPASVKLAADRQ